MKDRFFGITTSLLIIGIISFLIEDCRTGHFEKHSGRVIEKHSEYDPEESSTTYYISLQLSKGVFLENLTIGEIFYNQIKENLDSVDVKIFRGGLSGMIKSVEVISIYPYRRPSLINEKLY